MNLVAVSLRFPIFADVPKAVILRSRRSMFADMARTQINSFRGVFFEFGYFIELFTIFGAPFGIKLRTRT
jgi:hypothetical protein